MGSGGAGRFPACAVRTLVSHRLPLSRAPEAYRKSNDKTHDCTKVVLDLAR